MLFTTIENKGRRGKIQYKETGQDKKKKKKFPIEMLPDCEIEGKYRRESESRRTLKKLQCIMGKYLFDDTGDFT